MLLWSQLLILGLTFKANLPGCGCEKKIDATFWSNSFHTNVHKKRMLVAAVYFQCTLQTNKNSLFYFPLKNVNIAVTNSVNSIEKCVTYYLQKP